MLRSFPFDIDKEGCFGGDSYQTELSSRKPMNFMQLLSSTNIKNQLGAQIVFFLNNWCRNSMKTSSHNLKIVSFANEI